MKREVYSKSGKKKCIVFGISMDDFSRPMSTEYRLSVLDDKQKIKTPQLQRLSTTKEYFFNMGQETYIVTPKDLTLLLMARLDSDFNFKDKMRQGWH